MNRNLPMYTETATQRAAKNLKVIKKLLREIEGLVESTIAVDQFDWGDVGDLARIRSNLNDVLGREDSDPL